MRSGGSMLSQTPTGAVEDLVKPFLVMLNGAWIIRVLAGRKQGACKNRFRDDLAPFQDGPPPAASGLKRKPSNL
jgi:hypothetical protein